MIFAIVVEMFFINELPALLFGRRSIAFCNDVIHRSIARSRCVFWLIVIYGVFVRGLVDES